MFQNKSIIFKFLFVCFFCPVYVKGWWWIFTRQIEEHDIGCEEEEVDSTFTSRSQNSDIDESGRFPCSFTGRSSSDRCKDVDVVSVLPECSTSAIARFFGSEIIGQHSLKDITIISSHSQHRILEDPSLDYDSGFDSMSILSSMFEFQKAKCAPQRVPSATTFVPPPWTARYVSKRDMGTEMTPIASQEPSRTGSPVRATSPMHSPMTSQPSTLGRTNPESTLTCPPSNILDTNKNELSEKELQMKTRLEIMVLRHN
ncbi:hypothetical protein L6164_026323 [Bauhinia variegata]|uniref:Uncharacterized protein n=1 Tax=Bauhinia variegata TaxID=167791 RepID=A0ACB9LPC9_BAUVA|nr:hypothetical protein L6164_026323 [Bauhinia variegata]